MYKLIAIDLDGTLLDSRKQISQENKEAVQAAIKKGVKVAVCSGRIFAGAVNFARELGLEQGPLIACNGAIIRELHTRELLYSKLLSNEDCLRIIDICHRQNIYLHAYVEDTLYAEKLEFASLIYWESNKKLAEKDRVDIRIVDNLADLFCEGMIPATKLVIVSRDQEQLAGARELAAQIETVSIVSSDYDNFEVVSREVSKGNALRFIAQRLNISREEIIAIGDNENDLSMIEYAGMGIAMGNARSFVKDIAAHISLSNDMHGVAEAIRRFIL